MIINDTIVKTRKLMEGFCRVCKECNGLACAGEVPGMGGLNSGSSFIDNVKDLSRIKINMNLIHQISNPNVEWNFLGKKMSAPILVAPMSGVKFNMSKSSEERSFVLDIVNGSAESNLIACVGDGVPPELFESSLSALEINRDITIPFIKPWGEPEFTDKLEMCLSKNPLAIGIDIDAVGLITLAKMGRPVAPMGIEKLRKIVKKCHERNIIFILKGIMSEKDALLAEEIKADIIIISNHGGRVLDHTMSTCKQLQKIKKAVPSMKLWVDGGVRSGVDVYKMLALGAEAVLIGRPYAIQAIGAGQKGVATYSNKLISELLSAMVLTGSPTISDINSDKVDILW